MAKIADHAEKMAQGVTEGYKKIENGVVTGYKKIEDGVVNGYQKIENAFVNTFIAKEGETTEEAKARITGKEEN
jgi:hypothetical protein